MIKEYTISNFKAIARPATIPLKPITLIFGPNSSGKSSILQSLMILFQSTRPSDFSHFLKKMERFMNVDDNNSLNVTGPLIDLKSYKNIVYNQDTEKEIEIKFYFDVSEIEEYSISFIRKYDPDPEESQRDQGSEDSRESQPPERLRKTQQLIDTIKSDYNKVGVGSRFFVDNKSGENKAKSISLYIGDGDSLIDYYPVDDGSNTYRASKVSINKKHSFWQKYWKKYGREIAIKELNCMCNYMKKTGNDMHGNPGIKPDFVKIIELSNIISAGIDFDEVRLVDFFERYILTSIIFFENDAFYFREIEICDYSINDPWDQELYYTIDDIFSGLKNNNQDEYYSDNISIIAMITSILIGDTLNRIQHIGPVRNLPESYEDSDINREDQKYVAKDESSLPRILYENKYLVKDVNDSFKRLGITYNIEAKKGLNYFLTIHDNRHDIPLSLSDVGFGISQILPVIVQCIYFEGRNILIEQPELHLHPGLQAELGDLFIDSAIKKKNTLVIETHSEHLILRILRRIRETAQGKLEHGVTPITPDQVSVLYVEPDKNGSQVLDIRVNKNGEFNDPWPGGFFEEDFKELF